MVLDTDMDLDTWDSIFQSKIAELKRPGKWSLQLDDNIQLLPGWRQYTLHTSARFTCSVCHRRWESSKVRIIFHIKQASNRVQQGYVKMRIFKQECRKCNAAKLEEPVFMIENIDITLDCLVMRIRMKCYGEDVSNRPVPAFISNGRKAGPHDSAHCEACRLGLCDKKPLAEKKEAPTVHRGWDALNNHGSMKCYGEDVSNRPVPAFISNGRKAGPHDNAHCNACLLGLCDKKPLAKKKEAPTVYQRRDTFKSHGNTNVQDQTPHLIMYNESRYREPPQYTITRTNHPVYRAQETNCCPCVLL